MIHFIVQDWQNTHGNHAGMSYLCEEIKKQDPSNIRVFRVPNIRIRNRNIKFLQDLTYAIIAISLIFKIKNGSTVFLMEYLLPTHNQYLIARSLSLLKKVRLFGLAHLVPSDLKNYFKDDSNRISTWVKPLNGILTLGTSLSEFLIEKNIPKWKIHTLFHYVDLSYYKKETLSPTIQTEKLKIIIMGNMKRDFITVLNIMNRVPNVHFIFCCGKRIIDKSKFKYPQNITFCSYIPEDELKSLMNEADISLNVMFDTVGSNVITTSLAMGLALIVSDVGSIRNYCDETNAIFCHTETDFVEAISYLASNRKLVNDMKTASVNIAQKLSIPKFYTAIKSII